MKIKAIKSTLTLWPNEGQILSLLLAAKRNAKTNIGLQLATHINNKNIQIEHIKTSKHLNTADQKLV